MSFKTDIIPKSGGPDSGETYAGHLPAEWTMLRGSIIYPRDVAGDRESSLCSKETNNSIKQHENLIQRHGNAFSLAETRQNTNRPATQPTKYPRNSCLYLCSRVRISKIHLCLGAFRHGNKPLPLWFISAWVLLILQTWEYTRK